MSTQTYTLSQPELFRFEDLTGAPCLGLDQEWYRDAWQRRAGCGPTTASTLMAYLARTKPALASLAPEAPRTASGILPYMEAVWKHVTPTSMGLHTLALFIDGSRAFGQGQGVPLDCRSLSIPGAKEGARPSLEECGAFIREALEADCPVAFLNYSNGALSNLDSWHWVPLISLSRSRDGGCRCTALDAGKEHIIDFALWHQTSRLGGGLVSLHPALKT